VGNDVEGESLRGLIRNWNLDDSALQVDASHPTGEVTVSLSGGEAQYTIRKPCAWDFIDDAPLKASHLLYHGSLALRSPVSRNSFEAIAGRSEGAIRFFDINLRAPHYTLDQIKQWMHGADWVKLNLNELEEITGLTGITIDKTKEILAQLRTDFKIGNLLLTGGEQGAVIYGEQGHVSRVPAPSPSLMIDTVGAGDGFTAMTLSGILRNDSLDRIIHVASLFAAKVCQIQGATSQDPKFYQI
jgi:fructokinase